jgi:hypothetical protein
MKNVLCTIAKKKQRKLFYGSSVVWPVLKDHIQIIELCGSVNETCFGKGHWSIMSESLVFLQ